MKQIHELLGYKNIKIIQDTEMFSFSVDSMLLADFIKTSYSTKNIIDLCSGNAPIPLFLTLKTKALITGIEIQKEVYDLAVESVKLNNFENQITIINDDLKEIHRKIGANKFDIVSCNPPYFKYIESSNVNKNDYLTIARHEVKATLEDIIIESKKLLVDGGYLYMVHRCDRFSEICEVFTKNCFQIKTLRFVYSKLNSKEALFVLIEARKNRNPGTKILPPLYIYNENNEYTDEVKEIFNFGLKK
jgi:tRNA1(Val) A37 N6-methylase TrmN6